MLEILKNAKRVLITAGAGMGVDSGLPDFRGNSGFWKEYLLLKDKNISFEEIANPQSFTEHPNLAWAFYGHRYDLYKETRPHEGFKILLDFIKDKDYFILTSNVDNQFQKAGFDKENIYEVHGRINTFQCTECDNLWKADNYSFNVDKITLELSSELPKCPKCNKLARPNIMMFMDFSFNEKENNKQYKRFSSFKKEGIDVIIELGAGTAIPTIRSSGERLSRENNCPLIRINPREAQGPTNTLSIEKGALEGLKEIFNIF
jgi:NAD-dependent SIR2 family protein deacetylase